MFLGTSRVWWIAAGVCFVLGLGLIVTGSGGVLGAVAGVLLLFAAIAVFGAAPMRYGRQREEAASHSVETNKPAPPAAASPPQPRPTIEAGDASDV